MEPSCPTQYPYICFLERVGEPETPLEDLVPHEVCETPLASDDEDAGPCAEGPEAVPKRRRLRRQHAATEGEGEMPVAEDVETPAKRRRLIRKGAPGTAEAAVGPQTPARHQSEACATAPPKRCRIGRVQDRSGRVQVQDRSGRVQDRAGRVQDREQDRAGRVQDREQDRGGRVQDRSGRVQERSGRAIDQLRRLPQERAGDNSDSRRFDLDNEATGALPVKAYRDEQALFRSAAAGRKRLGDLFLCLVLLEPHLPQQEFRVFQGKLSLYIYMIHKQLYMCV